jgi:hypothetical protein
VVDGTGLFSYLVEACDPCEANNYAYDIAGIALSDFITPHFYDSGPTPGALYSFKGNIQRPRQVLPGGYISYRQSDGAWNQILWVDPASPPTYNNPAIAEDARSWREAVHTAMGSALNDAKHHQRRKHPGLPKDVLARVHEKRARRAAGGGYAECLRSRYAL